MGNQSSAIELQPTGELNGHQKPITLMTFYKNKLYTGSQDCSVRQYEPDSGLCIGVFKGHQKFISSMVISPSDGVLFTGDGAGTIMSWALERQIVLKTYRNHTKTISCLCLTMGTKFSPPPPSPRMSSSTLAIPSSSAPSPSQLSHSQASPSTSYLSTSANNIHITTQSSSPSHHPHHHHTNSSLLSVNTPTSSGASPLSSSSSPLSSSRVSFDRSSVSMSRDNVNGSGVGSGGSSSSVSSSLAAAAAASTMFLYSGSFDCTICQWSVDTGICMRTFVGHTDSITSIALSKNGRSLFSSSADKTVRKWNTEDGTCLLKLEGHQGWVWDFLVIPSTFTLFSCGMDGKLIKWNTMAGRALKEIDAHSDSICRLCFTSTRPSRGQKSASSGSASSNGSSSSSSTSKSLTLLSASWDGTIRQWDIDTGDLLQTMQGHTAKIKAMQVILDRVLITASEDQTVRIWDIKTGHNVFTLNNDKPIMGFCIGDTPQTLFVGCKDGLVKRFTLPKNKYTEKMEGKRETFFKRLNNAITNRTTNDEDEDDIVYGFSGAFGSGVAM